MMNEASQGFIHGTQCCGGASPVLLNFRSAQPPHSPVLFAFPCGTAHTQSCAFVFPAAQPTHSPVLLFSLRHSPQRALCQSSDKSDKSDWSDKSDILCPQYRHCAKCSASQQSPLLRPSTLRYAVASHVFWKLRSTWLSLHPVPPALRSLRRRRVRTSPYKSVQVRIPLPAPCALRKVLCQPLCPALRAQKNSGQMTGVFFA